MLGGGSSSRLFRDLREDKGYTYGLSARESAQKLGGVSYLGGRRARRRHRARPSGTCSRQVKALRDVPVPEAELADVAGRHRPLACPGDFATAAGIAGRVAEQVVYALPDDWWIRYPAPGPGGHRRRRPAGGPARPRPGPALHGAWWATRRSVKPQLDGLPLGDVEVRKP